MQTCGNTANTKPTAMHITAPKKSTGATRDVSDVLPSSSVERLFIPVAIRLDMRIQAPFLRLPPRPSACRTGKLKADPLPRQVVPLRTTPTSAHFSLDDI